MKAFISFLTIFLISYSCKKEPQPCAAKDLTPNPQEKAFFNVYDTLKVNDILRFANKDGNKIDTFIVNKVSKGYIDDNIGASDCDHYFHAYHNHILFTNKSQSEILNIDYSLDNFRDGVVEIKFQNSGYAYIGSMALLKDTTIFGYSITNVHGSALRFPPLYTPQDGLIFYHKADNPADPRVLLR